MKRKTKKSSLKRSAKRPRKAPGKGLFRFWYVSIVTVAVVALGLGFVLLKNPSFCANQISCLKNLSGKYEPSEKQGEFMGKSVSVPQEIATDKTNPTSVLGDTSAQKHIYVDLTRQMLYAYEGNSQVYQFPVSSGKWHPTPTGNFRIWIKLRYTRMTGGNPAIGTYYNLPNVPYTMFFSGDNASRADGYSLHGAYWHNNFGHPMSHGCVNMRIEDAHTIYDWANPVTTGSITYATDSDPGTPITIFGTTPAE